jgi:hypothetical protein
VAVDRFPLCPAGMLEVGDKVIEPSTGTVATVVAVTPDEGTEQDEWGNPRRLLIAMRVDGSGYETGLRCERTRFFRRQAKP